MDKEMESLLQENRKLELIEEHYWKYFTKYQDELLSYQEEKENVHSKISILKEQVNDLKTTNVYNDAFYIWHDGHFGTINNFRLGRLPSQQVDWNEINAALGQTTLLLYTLAKKLNFKFSMYRLIPMGSSSKIEKTR